AKMGSIKYGRISLLTSSRLITKNSFDVSPNCFYPKPKVNSSVLIMEPIINNNFHVKNIENLEKISHKFFSKKRKKIKKVFKELFKNSFEVAKKLQINLDLRPSQLSDIEYFKITKYFEDYIKN
ncbi:MAG: rRNA adenine N-6-methyltransferase family protein, partial [Pelagibacteraceae bacterium]